MWGQWIGTLDGSNRRRVILNIDRNQPFNGCIVVAYDDQPNQSFQARIVLEREGDDIKGDIYNFNLFSYEPDPAKRSAEVAASRMKGVLKGTVSKNTIDGQWETDNGSNGNFLLTHFEDYLPTAPALIMTWDDFKTWVLSEKSNNSGLIYRGHSDSSYTLQTSFHRHGRRDLNRYSESDVPELSINISATIGRSFSLNSPEEHGALLYLAQHHGYPTPLIDWTESPYVAAYFAFRELNKYEEQEGVVRIYQFDKDLWHTQHSRVVGIGEPRPSFSAHILNARDNKRALPQQSVVTFSNIFNVERFIDFYEQQDNEKYLTKIDIQKSDRNFAMKDLGIMGITASSLFPGLDGACVALREKHF